MDTKNILDEIAASLGGIPEETVAAAAGLLCEAPRVFVCGAGRSGLVARAFAMRLRHLGMESYVAGETICPPVNAGDVMVAVTGSGKTACTTAMLDIARGRGAKILLVTRVKKPACERGDVAVVFPEVSSQQFGNSLFEQAVFIFFDTLVLHCAEKMHVSLDDMATRHTNLE